MIKQLIQSHKQISANIFLIEAGRDLHSNISRQQNFLDILNDNDRQISNTSPHGAIDRYLKETPPIPNDKDQRPDHIDNDLIEEHFYEHTEMNQIINNDKQKSIQKPSKKKKIICKYITTTKRSASRTVQHPP